MDGTGYGMGLRSQRYAMVVDDGVVKTLKSKRPAPSRSRAPKSILKAL